MKRIILAILAFNSLICTAQTKFENWFTENSLRFDYIHAGDSASEYIFFENAKQEEFWAGPIKNLIDTMNLGEYRIQFFDKETDELLFSSGFCTLFEEWKTTLEAKTMKRSFYETLRIPFPRKEGRIEIQKRTGFNAFETYFTYLVNPKDYFISLEKENSYEVLEIVKNGNSHEKVDLVIIPDGYTESEMEKFKKDALRLKEDLFSSEALKGNMSDFNVFAVLAPSLESGTDIPGDRIYRNTIVGTSFYTLDSERYLMTTDVKSLHDVASCAPYDQIYILVNTDKYGGGAIYNYYNVSSADNPVSKFVIQHEFGHGFAGLGDEYYTSAVSYNDFFDLTKEPWQPNLTTMVDFDAKWKKMIDKKTPVPTPAEEKYYTKTGVFEGGGYVAKGVYRPFENCTMKSNAENGFCPVCRKAFLERINFMCDR